MAIYQPATVDFIGQWQIYQGSTFDIDITLTLAGGPLNLSAFNASPPTGQFRTPNFASPTVLLTPTYTWIDASIAKFNILITAAQTTALTMGSAQFIEGVHDIEVFVGGIRARVAKGTWKIEAEVTR